MRITIERRIDDSTTERFLALYREAFAPLETVAAARQSLTDDEFREEMSDPSVLKFVGWNRRGESVALMMVATDLDVVPWISAPFYRAQFPEQAARGAIYYFGALLVAPGVRGGPWAHRLLGEGVRFVAGNVGIAAFDCCRYNVEEIDVPRMVAEIGERLCYFDRHEVDVQRYYAYVSHGLKEVEIDLRDLPVVVETDEPPAAEDAVHAASLRGGHPS